MKRFAFALAALFATSAYAATPLTADQNLYVATTGNDANDCLTPSTPCLTLNGVGNVANSFDPDGHWISIFVADGTYSMGTWTPKFRDGRWVKVFGNTTTPANVVLNVAATNWAHGIALWGGEYLAWLDGFTINGVGAWQSHGVWAANSYGSGIYSARGSYIALGNKVRINKFYYGLRADTNGAIVVNGDGLKVDEAGDVGIFAFNGGSIECRGCIANNAAHTAEGLGFGFMAENGGSMIAEWSSASGNAEANYIAQSNGALWAHNTTSTGSKVGYKATESGSLEANYASATGNGVGYLAIQNSYINGWHASAANNTNNGFAVEQHAVIDANTSTSNNNTNNGYYAKTKGQITGPMSATGNGIAPPSGYPTVINGP